MVEYVEFPDFITKGIEVDTADERRIFKGHITAEIIDRQQEFIFVKEVMKIMETFMSVNPVISDYHSNRMVGKVLSYEKSEYQGVATVLITGEVYKKDGITLYDKVWDKVVKGEYAGLSMGGASKEREPIQKDGKMALELRKLELYEIALCDTPANPFAIIEEVNQFAKAVGLEKMVKEHQERQQIRCNSIHCKFEKACWEGYEQQGMKEKDGKQVPNCVEKADSVYTNTGTDASNPVDSTSNGTDLDVDDDLDHDYKCDSGEDKCDICGLTKAKHSLEQFDKPHKKLDSKTLVNRSAETRAENVGESTGSPKQVNDLMNSIPKIPAHNNIKRIPLTRIKKDHIEGFPEDIEEKGRKKNKEIEKDQPIGDIDAKGNFPQQPRQRPNTMTDSNSNVNKMIEHFGVINVKKAIEEYETIQYLKALARKYSI